MEEKIDKVLEILEKQEERKEEAETEREEKSEKVQKLAGMFSEQVDSVLRLFMSEQIAEWELDAYLDQLSREGLKTAVQASLSLVKEEVDTMVEGEGIDVSTALEEMDEETTQEMVELDGLMNQLFNAQIGVGEFVNEAKDFSEKELASMLAGQVLLIRKIKTGRGRNEE